MFRRSDRFTRWIICLAAGVACLFAASRLHGQEPVTTEADKVTINFPEEIDLAVLVDYVGKALEIHFVYGEELKGQKVELRPAPIQIPKAELLDLLASLLRIRELGLVEEAPKLFRIVKAEQTTRVVPSVRPVDAAADPKSTRMVTQVLQVPAGDVKGVAEKIERFLSFPKGGVLPLPEIGQIVITDYESRIAVLQDLIGLLGGAAVAVEVKTIPIAGGDATGLATQVSAILSETHRLAQKTGAAPSVRSDILPSSLVIVGTPAQIEHATRLVEELRPSDMALETRSYAPRYLSVDRFKNLIEHVALSAGKDVAPPASIYTDTQSGRLFVSAEAATHQAIAELLAEEDQPLPQAQRPMRIYRPKYRKASEVLTTIGQLLGEGVPIATEETLKEEAGKEPGTPPGPNRPPATPGAGQVPPVPPAQVPIEEESIERVQVTRVEGRDYVITADESTNAILAVGTREFHAHLAELIADLDQRRPQVLIEMTLIGITMSDTLDLGVELEAVDLGEAWDYLLFSNFGLSTINPQTGERVLIPGTGANGVLLRPDSVPFIFKTLATHANGKVISTPKLLVMDNAQGTLRNVDEAPFTSVNASDTVATTSFAGFESAGTTLTVTPHLSEGENVTLEYNLTFSNFSGTSSSATVPPPRTTNSFTSTVDIPDGYTLITGGLTVDNQTKTVSEVPLLGRIPALGKLFQSNSRRNTRTKIFAFIRPTIVREDEFEQLKYISLKDVEDSGLDLLKDLPGEPLWMR